jgi:hypothetical protein
MTMVLETVIGLPWEMYDTFIIEELHGFNKQVAFAFVSVYSVLFSDPGFLPEG